MKWAKAIEVRSAKAEIEIWLMVSHDAFLVRYIKSVFAYCSPQWRMETARSFIVYSKYNSFTPAQVASFTECYNDLNLLIWGRQST